jgi:hypothetical protein
MRMGVGEDPNVGKIKVKTERTHEKSFPKAIISKANMRMGVGEDPNVGKIKLRDIIAL